MTQVNDQYLKHVDVKNPELRNPRSVCETAYDGRFQKLYI